MKKEIVAIAVFGAFALTACQPEFVQVPTEAPKTDTKAVADANETAKSKSKAVTKKETPKKADAKKEAPKNTHKRVSEVKLSNNVLKSPCVAAQEGTEERIDCCYDVAEMCQPGGDGGSISDQLQTKCQSNKKADIKAFWQTKNEYCKSRLF